MYNSTRTNPTVNSVSEKSIAQPRTFSLQRINQRFFYLCLLVMCLLFAFNNAKAQTTYYWNFTTAAATSGSNANLTVDTFKRGNNFGTITTAIRTTTSASSAYSGSSGGTNIGQANQNGAFNSSTTGYFELTLTPAAGYTVQVTGLTFGRRSTGTGPQRYVIKTSKDNYVDSLAADTISANSGWALEQPFSGGTSFSQSITSAAGTALTLRIYGYNGTSTSSGTVVWRIDDVNLTVVVASSENAPAAPTSGGNQSVCIGSTIPDLSATAPSGAVVDWYANASGGSALSSGSNTYSTGQTTAGTYTYYAESRNSPGTLKSASRTAVSLTINPIVTPSVSASVDDSTPTPGQTITFTATPTNGGASPTYQWYKNNNPISSATNSSYATSSNYASNDVFYVIVTSNAPCASPATAQSSDITITIDNSACSDTPPTANASASNTSVCSGGSSSLSLTSLGGQTGYTFQWQDSTIGGSWNNISGETNSTLSASNITVSTWYRCVVTCSNTSLFTASNSASVAVIANETPLVSIASSLSPACAGTNVTITATPTFGGSSPTYAWYKNSNLVSGVTGATYSSTSFADGDVIYTVMTSNHQCLATPTATSNGITQNITANVAASVSIATSANPACAGANVTFTATPNNGGSSPTYQWYNGASPISGANNSTYSSASLSNNANISVVMTSNVTCVTGSPATSNTVIQGITTVVTPSLTIASNNNPVCISGSARFNINPTNGGTSPTYAWYINGVLNPDSTGTTYTINSVTNGDSVYATMVSNFACVTTANATSNVIIETIVSQATPTVSISANPGTNINEGTNITFTATTTFGGASPSYQWKVNGNNVGTSSSTYSSTTLLHGDVVSCVLTSNYTCLTTNTATSNNLTISIIGSQPFTPGNLIVYRSGDSVNTLTTNATAIYLSEYTTSGQFVQAKRISKNASGVNSIYCSGSSTSEGMMTLNTNGTNLVVPGYYTTQGLASITSANVATTKVVALVDVNQNLDSSTRLTPLTGGTDWGTTGSPRGAAANGNDIYVTGSTGGIRYAAKGTVGQSVQLSTSITNMRNVAIFNGQLYGSDNSGTTYKLSSIGTGLPTTSGQSFTNIPGFPTSAASAPYAFFFADLSSSVAGLDVVYVCDDAANTITKYSLASGTWTSNGTVTAKTVKGLTASISGTTVKLYGTAATTSPTSTYIYTYTDASGYNGSISGTATNLVDRTNVSLIAFRGIAFAPTSFTTQPSNTTVCTGNTTSLSVAMTAGTSASIYSYQWQASADGTNWGNISNGLVYDNVTTTTLSINDPTNLHNIKYRCVVTYMGCITMISSVATLTVITTVTPAVSISSSTGSSILCSSNPVTFSTSGTNAGSTPQYHWYINNSLITTSPTLIYNNGNSLNTGDVVTCILEANNTCQTTATATSNALTLTVNQSPEVAAISSEYGTTTTAFTMCVAGKSVSLYPTPTVGVWSSSDPAIATVTNVSGTSSATVNAVANGTATITFTRTTSGTTCTAASSVVVTVQPQTTPNVITSASGLSTMCVNKTETFQTASTGGVWSALGRVTINANTGFATATSAGATTIKYTTTNANGCSASSIFNVTVNPAPATPSISFATGTTGISGSGGYCTNKTFTLVGKPTGGAWSKTGVISMPNIPSGGLVNTGSITGGFSVTYTYTDANGCSNSRTIPSNIVACRGINTNLATSTDNTQLTIYPNPARSVINLKVKVLIGTGSIVITDLYGKQVKQQALSMGTNTIDVSTFAKGMYLVSIVTNDKKVTEKIIVE